MHAAGTKRTARDRRATGAERLLAAATKLFAAKGYDGTPVRRILEEAGVGPTVLYYHFGSKQGLYGAVVRRATDEYAAALDRAASASGSVVSRIGSVCRVHVDWRTRIGSGGLVAVLRDLVREGIERGELSGCDPDAAAAALAGIAASSSDDAEHSALTFVLEKLR